MRRLRWLVAGLIVGSSTPAFAQTASEKANAEALFESGKKLLEQGNYKDACPKFEASEKLDSGIGTLLFLGECYEKSGRVASAWATFREAESVARGRGDQERASIAKQRAAALEPRLSKLQIMVAQGSPADLVVKQDGAMVPRESWDIAVPVDPGSHTIEVSATGKRTWTQTVTIGADGAQARLDVPTLEDAPKEAAPPPVPASTTPPPQPVHQQPMTEESHGSAQRTIGIVVGLVGVAGVGVGTIFGLRAKSKNDDSKAECSPADENRCNAKGTELRDDAQSAATISTISFVVGGAALATGIVLIATAPSSEEHVAGPSLHLKTEIGATRAGIALGGMF